MRLMVWVPELLGKCKKKWVSGGWKQKADWSEEHSGLIVMMTMLMWGRTLLDVSKQSQVSSHRSGGRRVNERVLHVTFSPFIVDVFSLPVASVCIRWGRLLFVAARSQVSSLFTVPQGIVFCWSGLSRKQLKVLMPSLTIWASELIIFRRRYSPQYIICSFCRQLKQLKDISRGSTRRVMTKGCIEFGCHCAFFPLLPFLFLFSQQVAWKCRNKMKTYAQQTQRITLLGPEGVYLITTG